MHVLLHILAACFPVRAQMCGTEGGHKGQSVDSQTPNVFFGHSVLQLKMGVALERDNRREHKY